MNDLLDLADFASWGYGLTALVYGVFALYLYAAWRGSKVGGCLLAAVVLSCVWALVNLWWTVYRPGEQTYMLGVGVADALRIGGWFVFLLVLLRPLSGGYWKIFCAVAVAVLAVQLGGVLIYWQRLAEDIQAFRMNLGGSLTGAVLGFVLVEQLYRDIAQDKRWSMKPLCMGLGAMYMFEIYLFADAFLFGHPRPEILAVRGLAHALAVPLVALSGARNPSWTLRMSMSRSAVFHTTALGLSGVYLLVMSAAGYYVNFFGGRWGPALQTMLLFTAFVVLAVYMGSSAQRAKLRVFISKHLFPYRYDYRNEWLRFTRALSAADGQTDLGQAVIGALADLVESPGGVLWLRDDTGNYTVHARANQPEAAAAAAADSSLVQFMRAKKWVIDLQEFRSSATAYPGLMLPDWLPNRFPDAWLLIPLIGGTGMIGFVMLVAPRTAFEIDWEVLDLLKTAQHQAASDLERMLIAEDLLEARKFESFMRMSAFVVHDLKNLVAQLSLMLRNAERHKDNPEFQADMLETVRHVEAKMRGLMTQLQEKRSIDPPRAVDLAAVLENIRRARREQRPPVELDLPDGQAVMVRAHPERLERVIGHIVQNALEATPDDGKVRATLSAGQERTRIVVEDSGCGMSEDFIRERLSRPFETTKASGMGIGVYETRQYIRELGGEVTYESAEGAGTRVTIELPPHTRLDALGRQEAQERRQDAEDLHD